MALSVSDCAEDAPGERERQDSGPAELDGGASDAATQVDSSRPPDARADAATSDARAADPSASGDDEIYGQRVGRSESWWVGDGRIYYGEREVRLYGLNWFGLETEARALFGPAQANRTVADFLSQIEALGFNALRVPLSPESIDPNFPSADWAKHGEIDTGREQFEELARAARDAGVYMLWDIHTCASAVGYMKESPLDPACTGYGREKWIDNLKTLARLALEFAPWVIGIDLFNEPHGLSWPVWKELAEAGGQAVLIENPRILTFVEGVASEGYEDPDGVFWGENLALVANQPVALPAARLVYSPHVYGPSVYSQSYFGAADFPANMPAIWDRHFGYLFTSSAQPVVLGEFGGRYESQDKIWQDAFARYLVERGSRSFFYWCLNPNSGDTGGLLLDDFRTVDMQKLSLLESMME